MYYWDGATPVGHQLRDISLSGAYLYTPERWYPGTIIRLLLQKGPAVTSGEGFATEKPSASASIPARVVRHGPDGVAVEFFFRTPADRELLMELIARKPGEARS